MNTAEERKKRFQQLKEDAGGIEEANSEVKSNDYRLYFDLHGNITCFTNDYSIIPKEHWQTEHFEQEQLKVLIGADLTKYRVKHDPKDADAPCVIEPKPIESVRVDVESDFMFRVGYDSPETADLLIEVLNDKVVVTLNDKVKQNYTGIYPISATINGHRLIKLYFTAPGDPHTLFHYEVIALADLLVNDYIEFSTNLDFRTYGIYTQKLFEEYARRDK